MSNGMKKVKTLTVRGLAKKHNLPLEVIAKKVAHGVSVEKEHTASIRQASEIARDHLGERPDYYEKLSKMEKVPVNENTTTTTGVGGLGFVTGTPAIDADNQYVDTNSMSYEDWNGAILKMIRDRHNKHLVDMGFTSYSPNDIQTATNKIVSEANLNELGEYDNKGGSLGYEGTTGPIRAVRKNEMAENDLKNACWKGYTARGLKKKGDRMVPNCVPVKESQIDPEAFKVAKASFDKQKSEYQPPVQTKYHLPDVNVGKQNPSVQEDWQLKKYKNPEGGMTKAGVMAYRRENPGSKLQTAVTTEPSKLKPGSKAANRRKSFCARMSGVEGPMKDDKGRPTRKALALRKWNCEEAWMPFFQKHHVHSARLSKEKANKPDTIVDPGAGGTTKTVYEETKMDTKSLINEALENIVEDNLSNMKENLLVALQEKAIEKLEERKKEIAANFFSE